MTPSEGLQLRSMIERLRHIKEGPNEKRIRMVQELVDLFSQDQIFADQVLKNTFSLWNKYQENDFIYGEERASDLLRIKNFSNTPSFHRSNEELRSLLDFEKEPEYHTYSNSPSDPEAARKELPTELKNHLQDILTAYLFSLNRKIVPNNIFDVNREKRQIEATVSFIEGSHIQMGTGEGKSTTVFPITALVKSLTGDKVVLSTPDEINLADLQENIETFTSEIKKRGITTIPDINFIRETPPQEDQSVINLRKKMNVEAVLNGRYSEETEKEIKRIYWQKKLGSDDGSKNRDILTDLEEIKGPKIVLATDRDLVFSYSAQPKKFLQNIDNIYMDEADIPFSRKSPYVVTQEPIHVLPDDSQRSLHTWMDYYLTYHLLNKNDLAQKNGTYSLSDDAQKKLDSLRFDRIFEDYSRERKLHGNQAKVIHNFKNALRFIKKSLSLTKPQIDILEQKLVERYRDSSWQNEQAQSGLFLGIGTKLARLFNRKNVDYLLKDGEIAIRDAYTDQILESHEYQPEEKIAVLAIEGKFSFVPLSKDSSTSLRFESFIKMVGPKLHCASGTLKFPDPETKEINSTSFASFLKDYTGNEIITVVPPEIKNLPDPELFPTDKETIDALINKTTIDKPSLVISYNIADSIEIFERLKDKFGEEQVVYIESKPSNPKKIEKYNDRVKKIYKDLSDGKIKIVISSGAASFAVNILKSDGSPPDLHVTIHNLPTNRAQLMQIMGRRRMPGDDFSWFVSEKYLEKEFFSYFEEKESLFGRFYQKKLDLLEIREQIKKAKTDPKIAKTVILKLLKEREKLEKTDESFIIGLDKMINILNLHISRYYAQKIINDPELNIGKDEQLTDNNTIVDLVTNKKSEEDIDPKTMELVNKVKDWLTLIGQPDFYFAVYEKIPELFNSLRSSGSGSVESTFNLLTKLLTTDIIKPGHGDSFLKSLVDHWFDQKKPMLIEFKDLIDGGIEPISHVLVFSVEDLSAFNPIKNLSSSNQDIVWGTINRILAYKDIKNNQIFYLFSPRKNSAFTYYEARRFQFFGNNSVSSFKKRKSILLQKIVN